MTDAGSSVRTKRKPREKLILRNIFVGGVEVIPVRDSSTRGRAMRVMGSVTSRPRHLITRDTLLAYPDVQAEALCGEVAYMEWGVCRDRATNCQQCLTVLERMRLEHVSGSEDAKAAADVGVEPDTNG